MCKKIVQYVKKKKIFKLKIIKILMKKKKFLQLINKSEIKMTMNSKKKKKNKDLIIVKI